MACGVWRVVRKHRNIIMRGFRIRTCSQGGWPPGRAPGQLPPSMPPASPNRPRSPPLPGSHPLDDGIALEQSPVEPAHPDAVHAPPAAVVAAVVRGCGLTPLAVPSGGPGLRVEPHGPISPWAAPALDAGREPRRRQFECAAAKSKAGVLWLVQAADR